MIEKRYGRILNIASLAALRGLPNLFSYSAAKGGVTAIARLGTPRDVAHMAAYLTSPEAEFITGQTFPCDGGWSTK
jgi:NAD(P)-dependent dehydrogenase (short-subunit alcohol dehydrogenase family)